MTGFPRGELAAVGSGGGPRVSLLPLTLGGGPQPQGFPAGKPGSGLFLPRVGFFCLEWAREASTDGGFGNGAVAGLPFF